MQSPEAKCAHCGVTVAITDLRSNGVSYVIKPPGFSLSDLCPVIIKRNKAGKPALEEECPNLAKAINDRIEQFSKDNR